MPELPEIETVKLQLQKALIGKTISQIEVLKERTVIGDAKMAEGKEVLGIKRKGKVLIIDLTDDMSLAFHFKMTGQLVFEPIDKSQVTNYKKQNRIVGGHPTKDFIGELPSKHTRVIIRLMSTSPSQNSSVSREAGATSSLNKAEEEQSVLYFNDQRLFGWMKVGNTEDINNMAFIEKLGPEIWDIQPEDLEKRLARIKRPIKLAIMDQKVISGVGNIYANDSCWIAEIDPRSRIDQISSTKIQKLYEAIKQVLEEGIKYGGATAADAKYIDLHGMGGHYQDHFKVYDRKGKPCLRDDGGVIEKESLGGRGTYWCPVCQK